MKMKSLVVAALLLSTPSALLAHGPKNGPHGGQLADAGTYHVEILPQGTNLQVFVSDGGDQAVTVEGFKATAILVVNGKPQRILLSANGDNRLAGVSPVELPARLAGALLITLPSGATLQAKFE